MTLSPQSLFIKQCVTNYHCWLWYFCHWHRVMILKMCEQWEREGLVWVPWAVWEVCAALGTSRGVCETCSAVGQLSSSRARRAEEGWQLMTSGPTHITWEPEPPARAAAGASSLAPVEAGSGSDAEASKGKRDLWTPDVRSNQPFLTGECTGNLLPPYFPIHIYCLNDHFCIFHSRCNGNSLVTDKC